MARPREPFVHVDAPCPACGEPAPNRYLKTKLHTVADRDPDGRPTALTWLDPDHEGIDPLRHNVWWCGSCHFAAELEPFRDEDDRPHNFPLLVETWRDRSDWQRAVCDVLAAGIRWDDDEVPLESAVRVHLLAIFAQEMLSEWRRDTEVLGRLHLRLSWLLRGAEEGGGAPDPAALRPERWDDAPVTARDGAARAADFYVRWWEIMPREDPAEEIRVLNLIGYLRHRTGDVEGAVEYTRKAFEASVRHRAAAGDALGERFNRHTDNLREYLNGLREELVVTELARTRPRLPALAADVGGDPARLADLLAGPHALQAETVRRLQHEGDIERACHTVAVRDADEPAMEAAAGAAGAGDNGGILQRLLRAVTGRA